MSSHYSDDQLTLYYYGEAQRSVDPAAIDAHLQTCPACAALYREISGTLAIVVAPDVPERSDQYGLEVWQQIRHRLPEPEERGFWSFLQWNPVALAGAAAILIVAAFVAGRTWRAPAAPATAVNVGTPVAAPGAAAAAKSDGDPARQRILLTAVADHLDRSERVLTDIMNASAAGTPGGRDDISAEQRWADDLVTTSRLYRQDAIDAGEQSVASVLDELERTLIEIVHSPSKITAADLEQIRRRIDAAALLFKVRVMGDELRRREAGPADRTTSRTSTSTVS